MVTPLLRTASASGAVLAAALAAWLIVAAAPAQAKQPSPDQDGFLQCASEAFDEDSNPVVFKDPFSYRCCYQENWGDGEGPVICYTCDRNWKNCSKDFGDVTLPMLKRFRDLSKTTGGAVLSPTVDGRTTTRGGGGVLGR